MYILAKLLKALHSDAGPWSLAFGIAFGMMMGLTPLFSLHNLLVLFIVLFCRVNLSSFLLSLGLFSLFAYLLDPLMMNIGESLLSQQNLSAIWTAFYNTGVGRLSQFNNTLMMGSVVLSLILFPLLVMVSKFLVINYRQHVLQWMEKWKVVQLIKGSRFYRIYQGMGG